MEIPFPSVTNGGSTSIAAPRSIVGIQITENQNVDKMTENVGFI
jgi:hypothetical protein